jgi:hypothetical protein
VALPYRQVNSLHNYHSSGASLIDTNDSVWRPLCKQVEDTPLAFCDPRSVNVKDLRAVDRPGEYFSGEMYILQHATDQRWYYLSHQKPHEVFVFVTWDSDTEEENASGRHPESVCPQQECVLTSAGIPHSAFNLPGWEEVASLRESVEVRAIIITDQR